MTTIKEWYARVDATWPEPVPTPSVAEALKGAKKLYRFALGQNIKVEATSGNRYTWPKHGVLMVNPDHRGGHHRGWEALVHDLSHYAHQRLHPGIKPHSREHARLELKLAKEVVKRGWLAGTLEPVPVVAATPGKDERKAKIRMQIEAGIGRWEKKEKRAHNALRKLRRRLRYYV